MLRTTILLGAVAAVIVTCGTSSAHAATLAAVPMQGGMVMPMVAYHAEQGRLRVMMPADVPQLTPLMVSHPGDSFDAADPWFDSLDPSRQGLSFSRRYGFVMDTMTDPVPADAAIWIRKVSGPPELGFYRYAASAPKAWEPIFGTAGTPAARAWNGMMFHPGVTGPPGTEPLAATFEVYLANALTSEEVAGSVSDPFVLRWTNVSDGRPTLDVRMKLVVAWPTEAAGYVLESADSFPASEWTPVPNTPAMLEGRPAVVLEAGARMKFFRMRKSP